MRSIRRLSAIAFPSAGGIGRPAFFTRGLKYYRPPQHVYTPGARKPWSRFRWDPIIAANELRDLSMREILQPGAEEEEDEEIDFLESILRELEDPFVEEEEGYWNCIDVDMATQLSANIAKMAPWEAVSQVKKFKQKGNEVTKMTLLFVFKELRRRKRYHHAAELADWLNEGRPVPVDDRDEILRIELHALRGNFQKAQRLFQRNFIRDEAMHCALLLAYVKVKMVQRSEYVFTKLKDENLIVSPRPFNLMAALYKRRGRSSKLVALADEAKELNIKLGADFNALLLSCTYELEGLEATEAIFERIKLETPHSAVFISMADCYVSAGRPGQAAALFEEIEQQLESEHQNCRIAYHSLLELNAKINNEDGMEKTWSQLLKLGDPVASSYLCCIKAWGRIGNLEKAERSFKEADAGGKLNTSAVFGAMFRVYRDMGMIQQARVLKLRMEGEYGVHMDAACYLELIQLLISKGENREAIATFRECLDRSVFGSQTSLSAILTLMMELYAGIPDVAQAEATLEEWKQHDRPLSVAAYNCLLLAYLNEKRKPADGFIERMLMDGVGPNQRTHTLFKRLNQEISTEDAQTSTAAIM